MGMLGQLTIGCLLESKGYYNSHIEIICFVRIIWRFFGISSGCVAFIMAIERYFALTKPFFYCQHFTNGLIKRLILAMWASCAALTFAPVFGFGIFCDVNAKKCERYRDGTQKVDVAYAFLFFLVGEFSTCSIFNPRRLINVISGRQGAFYVFSWSCVITRLRKSFIGHIATCKGWREVAWRTLMWRRRTIIGHYS